MECCICFNFFAVCFFFATYFSILSILSFLANLALFAFDNNENSFLEGASILESKYNALCKASFSPISFPSFSAAFSK